MNEKLLPTVVGLSGCPSVSRQPDKSRDERIPLTLKACVTGLHHKPLLLVVTVETSLGKVAMSCKNLEISLHETSCSYFSQQQVRGTVRLNTDRPIIVKSKSTYKEKMY